MFYLTFPLFLFSLEYDDLEGKESKALSKTTQDSNQLHKLNYSSYLNSNLDVDLAKKKSSFSNPVSENEIRQNQFRKLFAGSFQPTKTSSIRKLKYFFGEKVKIERRDFVFCCCCCMF